MRHTRSVILLVLLLGATAVFAFPALTFFTSDTGLRFIQMENLIASDWQTLAIAYPWRALDPDLRYLPYYFAYGVVDGQIFFNISPFFPMAAALFYDVVGRWGVLVVPMMATLATAVSAYYLARLTNLPRPQWVLWATVFATPMLFYSFTVWDHTVGAALATAAVLAVAGGRQQDSPRLLLLGGVLVGLGTGQRPELYVFAVALGLALILTYHPQITAYGLPVTAYASRLLLYALGGLLGAAPLWWFNYRWVGHPLGMSAAPNLFAYGRPATVPASSFNRTAALQHSRFFTYIEPGNVASLIATVLVLLGLLLLVYALRNRPIPHLLGAGVLLAVVGYGLLPVIAWPLPLTGVIATFPLIPFSIAYLPISDSATRPVYHLVYATAVLFIVLLVLNWPTGGGRQWGARYVLPVYPLLAVLAWVAVGTLRQRFTGAARRMLLGGAGVLLATAVLLQLTGVVLLRQTRLAQAELQAQLGALDAEVIITNDLLLPAYMAALPDKSFLYVNTGQISADLLRRLYRHGVEQVAWRGSDDRPLTLPDQVSGLTMRPLGPSQVALEASGP